MGIAKAIETSKENKDLELWLSEGRQGTMEWLKKRKEERGNIYNYFPEAKSVISLAMNYCTGIEQLDLQSNFKFYFT